MEKYQSSILHQWKLLTKRQQLIPSPFIIILHSLPETRCDCQWLPTENDLYCPSPDDQDVLICHEAAELHSKYFQWFSLHCFCAKAAPAATPQEESETFRTLSPHCAQWHLQLEVAQEQQYRWGSASQALLCNEPTAQLFVVMAFALTASQQGMEQQVFPFSRNGR